MKAARWVVLALVAGSVGGAAAGPSPAAFPGKNGRIVFASLRDGNYELYATQPDATDLTRLTRNPGADIHPAWSPGGQRIAFASDRAGNPDIHVVATDGSGVTKLTDSTGADFDPDWSPDSARIAFVSNRDGDEEIYVMSADGTAQTRISNAGGADRTPAWSPDGRTIAFASARAGAFSLYAMAPDGSNQRRLTAAVGEDVSPSWSPDGTRIAFCSNRDGNYEIYVMNADGTGLTRLTRNLSADIDPGWSPDGRQIAFTSTRDVNYEIYAMNADGSAQTRLTTNEAEDTTANWESIPIPPPVVSSAFFRERWRESVFGGELVVEGQVAAPTSVRFVLEQGQRVRMTETLELPAGPFARALGLPRTLLPGDYVLEVTPGAAAGTAQPQTIPLELSPPREGVVRGAWASTSPGGAPLTRFPPRTPVVFAHFAFAALPASGLPVSVAWYRPGGRLAGPRRRKPTSALVVAFVGGRNGAPLPRGVWQCVIRAGPTVVKRLRFRVG